MKINLIRIGNSRGVRLPKAVIEQCGLEDRIELEIEDGAVVLRPASIRGRAREGWGDAFEKAGAGQEDEKPLLGDFPNEFDEAEWTW